MTESIIANTAQHGYWNTVAGPRWVGLGDLVEQRVQAVNDLLLARSAVIGCELVMPRGTYLLRSSESSASVMPWRTVTRPY